MFGNAVQNSATDQLVLCQPATLSGGSGIRGTESHAHAVQVRRLVDSASDSQNATHSAAHTLSKTRCCALDFAMTCMTILGVTETSCWQACGGGFCKRDPEESIIFRRALPRGVATELCLNLYSRMMAPLTVEKRAYLVLCVFEVLCRTSCCCVWRRISSAWLQNVSIVFHLVVKSACSLRFLPPLRTCASTADREPRNAPRMSSRNAPSTRTRYRFGPRVDGNGVDLHS